MTYTSHNCKLLIPVNLIIHHTDTGFISSAQVSINLSMLSVNFCSCVCLLGIFARHISLFWLRILTKAHYMVVILQIF